MRLTDPDAIPYLEQSLGVHGIHLTPLGGGVSNLVMLVESPETRLVAKQSLGQLQVAEEWLADRARIHAEAGTLRRLHSVLPPRSIPAVVFEDPAEFLYVMTAAPADAATWKARLMTGDASLTIAGAVGRIQGAMVAASFNSQSWRQGLDDLEFFRQLRLDPYYVFTSHRHPALRSFFEAGIARAHREQHCLTHGDWSPKNLMVSAGNVMAIDFEVVHFGDGTFDTAFLLNHLLLKSFWRPESGPSYQAAALHYWTALCATMGECPRQWMEAGTLLHLPLLLLARIDGKSPVEYIRDQRLKDRIRRFAIDLMESPPRRVEEIFERRQAWP